MTSEVQRNVCEVCAESVIAYHRFISQRPSGYDSLLRSLILPLQNFLGALSSQVGALGNQVVPVPNWDAD